MPHDKQNKGIDVAVIEQLDTVKHNIELENRLDVLRERLNAIRKDQVVSQKIMDLEFCF